MKSIATALLDGRDFDIILNELLDRFIIWGEMELLMAGFVSK